MLDKLQQFVAQPLPHKILFFDGMLTPKLIRLVYWLSLFVIVCTGIAQMFSGGFGHFLGGILYIVIGALCARILSELVILLFKMNDRIDMVVKNTQPTSTVRKKSAKKVSKKATKKTPT